MSNINVHSNMFCIITGHSWGRGKNGVPCRGCDHQETFINCADIRIKGWNVDQASDPAPAHVVDPPNKAPPATLPIAKDFNSLLPIPEDNSVKADKKTEHLQSPEQKKEKSKKRNNKAKIPRPKSLKIPVDQHERDISKLPLNAAQADLFSLFDKAVSKVFPSHELSNKSTEVNKASDEDQTKPTSKAPNLDKVLTAIEPPKSSSLEAQLSTIDKNELFALLDITFNKLTNEPAIAVKDLSQSAVLSTSDSSANSKSSQEHPPPSTDQSSFFDEMNVMGQFKEPTYNHQSLQGNEHITTKNDNIKVFENNDMKAQGNSGAKTSDNNGYNTENKITSVNTSGLDETVSKNLNTHNKTNPLTNNDGKTIKQAKRDLNTKLNKDLNAAHSNNFDKSTNNKSMKRDMPAVKESLPISGTIHSTDKAINTKSESEQNYRTDMERFIRTHAFNRIMLSQQQDMEKAKTMIDNRQTKDSSNGIFAPKYEFLSNNMHQPEMTNRQHTTTNKPVEHIMVEETLNTLSTPYKYTLPTEPAMQIMDIKFDNYVQQNNTKVNSDIQNNGIKPSTNTNANSPSSLKSMHKRRTVVTQEKLVSPKQTSDNHEKSTRSQSVEIQNKKPYTNSELNLIESPQVLNTAETVKHMNKKLNETASGWGTPLSTSDVLAKADTISKLLKAQELVDFAHDHILPNPNRVSTHANSAAGDHLTHGHDNGIPGKSLQKDSHTRHKDNAALHGVSDKLSRSHAVSGEITYSMAENQAFKHVPEVKPSHMNPLKERMFHGHGHSMEHDKTVGATNTKVNNATSSARHTVTKESKMLPTAQHMSQRTDNSAHVPPLPNIDQSPTFRMLGIVNVVSTDIPNHPLLDRGNLRNINIHHRHTDLHGPFAQDIQPHREASSDILQPIRRLAPDANDPLTLTRSRTSDIQHNMGNINAEHSQSHSRQILPNDEQSHKDGTVLDLSKTLRGVENMSTERAPNKFSENLPQYQHITESNLKPNAKDVIIHDTRHAISKSASPDTSATHLQKSIHHNLESTLNTHKISQELSGKHDSMHSHKKNHQQKLNIPKLNTDVLIDTRMLKHKHGVAAHHDTAMLGDIHETIIQPNSAADPLSTSHRQSENTQHGSKQMHSPSTVPATSNNHHVHMQHLHDGQHHGISTSDQGQEHLSDTLHKDLKQHSDVLAQFELPKHEHPAKPTMQHSMHGPDQHTGHQSGLDAHQHPLLPEIQRDIHAFDQHFSGHSHPMRHKTQNELHDPIHHSGNHPQSTLAKQKQSLSNHGHQDHHMHGPKPEILDPIHHSGNHPQSALAELKRRDKHVHNAMSNDRDHILHSIIAKAGHTNHKQHNTDPNSTQDQRGHLDRQSGQHGHQNEIKTNLKPNGVRKVSNAGKLQDRESTHNEVSNLHSVSSLSNPAELDQHKGKSGHAALLHGQKASNHDHKQTSISSLPELPPAPSSNDRWTKSMEKTTIDDFVQRLTTRMDKQVNKSDKAGRDTHIKVLPLSKDTIIRVLHAIAYGNEPPTSDRTSKIDKSLAKRMGHDKYSVDSNSIVRKRPLQDMKVNTGTKSSAQPNTKKIVKQNPTNEESKMTRDLDRSVKNFESIKARGLAENRKQDIPAQRKINKNNRHILDLSDVEATKTPYIHHNRLRGRKTNLNKDSTMPEKSRNSQTPIRSRPLSELVTNSEVVNRSKQLATDKSLERKISSRERIPQGEGLPKRPRKQTAELKRESNNIRQDLHASSQNSQTVNKQQHLTRSYDSGHGQRSHIEPHSKLSEIGAERSERDQFQLSQRRSHTGISEMRAGRNKLNQNEQRDNQRQNRRVNGNTHGRGLPNPLYRWRNRQASMKGFRGAPFSPSQNFMFRNSRLPGDGLRLSPNRGPERQQGGLDLRVSSDSPSSTGQRSVIKQQVHNVGRQRPASRVGRTGEEYQEDKGRPPMYRQSRGHNTFGSGATIARNDERHTLSNVRQLNPIPDQSNMRQSPNRIPFHRRSEAIPVDSIERIDTRRFQRKDNIHDIPGSNRRGIPDRHDGASHVISDSEFGRGKDALRTMRRIITQSEQRSAAQGDPRRRIVVLPLNKKTVSRIFGEIGPRRQA